MTYLTIEAIKQQLRIDSSFADDDALLEALGNSAEDFLQAHLNNALDDIAAENAGSLPDALMQALKIMVDYLYDESGSGDSKPVPQAFWILTNPFKTYSIA